MKRDEVPIRSRCNQTWSELRGSGPVRHCEVCDAPVTNLSLLHERAARDVLARGPQCIAYRHRPDGSIVFAEALRRPSTRGVVPVALLLAACGVEADPAGPAASEAPLHRVEGEAEPAPPTDAERPRDPHTVEACRRLLGAEARAQNRREMSEEAPPLDCELLQQLSALGGYGLEIPEACQED